jgi:hypothetical protein
MAESVQLKASMRVTYHRFGDFVGGASHRQ